MKWLLFVLILNTHLAFSGLNCEKFTKDRKLALRITKTWNEENELRFGVSVKANCSFAQNNTMNVYWYLAKRDGKPCEDPFDDEVEDLIGYKTLIELKESMVKRIDDQTLQVTLPKLPAFAEKVDSNKRVSSDIYFTLKDENGKCTLNSRTLVSGKWIYLNRIHNTIKFFGLKKVEYFLDDESNLSL